MAAKRKSATADFRRDEPDLPADLDSGRMEDGEFVTIHESRVGDVERPGVRIGEMRAEGSVLERIQLAGCEIGSAAWKDVRLTACDFANMRAHRMTLQRVELIDCRLTGLSSASMDVRDVLFRKCDLRYAQLREAAFRNCEFLECNLEDADLQGANLCGCILQGCDLGRADFRGARLQDADLRRSQVEGMVVGVGDLEGTIVDPSQAMVLARLMGLRIL